ncbi:hypothetical protein [Paraburkholderia ginsengiterrae]|uniref:hypothetical protein n=1 Tax=Paraburkholderia ginsengiterrae TaxID=1462993 RepID=UPI0012FB4041|nr:hypothetical protein [Paraburkholderia ginsengiterrae]
MQRGLGGARKVGIGGAHEAGAQQLLSVGAASGGKAGGHSARVRAVEVMASYEVAQAPDSEVKAA